MDPVLKEVFDGTYVRGVAAVLGPVCIVIFPFSFFCELVTFGFVQSGWSRKENSFVFFSSTLSCCYPRLYLYLFRSECRHGILVVCSFEYRFLRKKYISD